MPRTPITTMAPIDYSKGERKQKRKKTSKNKRLKGTVKGKWGQPPKPRTTVRRTKRKSPTPKKRQEELLCQLFLKRKRILAVGKRRKELMSGDLEQWVQPFKALRRKLHEESDREDNHA